MDTLRSNVLEVVSEPEIFTSAANLVVRLGPANQSSTTPALKTVLRRNGPLPTEALYLGQAEDDFPVLLNLHDPLPGPLLIVGKEGAGKTQFLRSIAEFVRLACAPRNVQFGVITNRADEWQHALSGHPNCVGVFPSHRSGARRFVQSLAMWIKSSVRSGQSVLMLVDGFEELSQWDAETRECLHTILCNGTEQRVWPIMTLHPQHSEAVHEWLSLFHLRFFEHGLTPTDTEAALDVPKLTWVSPVCGTWFTLKEHSGWIRFWIPSVTEEID